MKRSRSTAPILISIGGTCGMRPSPGIFRNGSSVFNCLIRTSLTNLILTSSMQPKSSQKRIPIKKVGHLVLDRCVDNFFAETEQVAFCTANVVPGVDFSNDPLLQGRNFSYLDTQVKRLGGPNFTYLPVNAPKCPMHTLQQDGHMASANPKTRVNYEPNSWSGELGGPRESPEQGFESYPSPEEGPKLRVRSETFADHYSQARQFYISQTKVEQDHIAASFTFELSKVETLAIRSRLVSHLLNVAKAVGEAVAKALGLKT